jgi:hypothetical protein
VRRFLSLRRLPIFGVLLLVGLGFWAWDARTHDHEGAHGAPMTAAQMEAEMTEGAFTAEDGSKVVLEQASCVGDGDQEGGGWTHFTCDLEFDDGSTDEVVVHNLPDELFFKSAEG